MEPRRPDPGSYGRVTNPDRYRVVADAAEALVGRLVGEFHVVRSIGDVATDFPDWRGPERETVRLVSVQGAPITFLTTSFPGVVIRFGTWGHEPFPSCGCDACDENPVQEIERMVRLVETTVAGGYRERMTRRWLWRSFTGTWGSQESRSRLHRRERRRLGDRGIHDWPPWARRPDSDTTPHSEV